MNTSKPLASSKETEAATGARLAEAVGAASMLNSRTLDTVLVPEGYTVASIEEHLPTPVRRRARVSVQTVESLGRYLARFPQSTPAVFADPEKGRFELVLDFHHDGSPEHGDHRCTLQLVHTDAWKAWLGHDGRKVSQVSFAEFVETHLADIVEPASGKVLDAVRHISAVRNMEVASKVDLDKGDLRFSFSSETKGKGEVFFPERIALALAPFEGSALERVEARVRYRVSDEGELTLWYQLLDPDEVLRVAAQKVLEDVEHVVGEESVFRGTLAS